MSNDKKRGELLAAFEAHKSRIAAAMIGGGEGSRVRRVLELVNLSDFEAGWQASRELMVIKLTGRFDLDRDCGEYPCSDGEFIRSDDAINAIEAAGLRAV